MIQSGDTIGPYTLMHIIGRGGYGEVWLAEKRSSLLTTQVALKLPLIAENDVEAVRKEAALWLQASGHPNIVPVLDAEVYEGQVVIASEYISGGSLYGWMQVNGGKAPSLEEAIVITNGILAGLDYLHRVGLTHRDLKPDNVLLQDGIPRLTDFGLARVLKSVSSTSTILGTPHYMAPETFSGDYSAASDLWAVGVMLHELLAGSHPFPANGLMELIVAIQSAKPSPLPESVPERIREIVLRLLARSPADRYPTVTAVMETLRSALAPIEIQNPKPESCPNNLPIQPTSFVGREDQLSELKALLANTSLLTLTGIGGCGKTRLSLQVAEESLTQFEDGVWLVELAPLTDPSHVASAIATTCGIKASGDQPLISTICQAFKDRQVLLLLDNCEHLLTETARIAENLLRGCPDVVIMASSREALNIAGEQCFHVPSLSIPKTGESDFDSILTSESVRLFCERASAARSDFSLTPQNARAVASVCRRLDGIPLALELAAARIRVLPIEEIETRLDNRFRLLTGGSRTALPRQQTLRALIDWSYDLLDARQKTLLCRLSVFAGEWSLDAAEQVCSDDDAETHAGDPDSIIESWQVLDLHSELAEKSLVALHEFESGARYRLLETVRQYARERSLEIGGDEAVRRRHRDWFLALAEEASRHYRGPEQAKWLGRLERDHENLRAALDWSLYESDPTLPLRFTAALARLWCTFGHVAEGREWCARALDQQAGQEPFRARAETLHGAGLLAYYQSDYAASRLFHTESLAQFRALGDDLGVAESLSSLGNVADEFGEFAVAAAYQEEGLAIRRRIGDRLGIATTLNNLGNILYHQGDLAAARVYQEECLSIVQELGYREAIASALNNLGNLANDRGDNAAAEDYHRRGLDMVREIGDKRSIAISLNNLGSAILNRDLEAARELFHESMERYRELGERRGVAITLNNLGEVDLRTGQYDLARLRHTESLRIRSEIGDRRGEAESLIELGRLAARSSSATRSAILFGAATTLRESLGLPLLNASTAQDSLGLPSLDADGESPNQEVLMAWRTLGEARFSEAWETGRAMSTVQAIEFALNVSDA